jgi:hypothetical protein
MQPYFFPYLGYFQLLASVDIVVLYDDVNFTKKGWIHRNRLNINQQAQYFGLQLNKASQNKAINEIDVIKDSKFIDKSLRMIEMNYSKAQYFNEVFPLIQGAYSNLGSLNLAKVNADSITTVLDYLELHKRICFSSDLNIPKGSYSRSERLMAITKSLGSNEYVNVKSGENLYSKQEFANNNIDLKFLEFVETEYDQGFKPFIPSLSILDVLMHNSKSNVKAMLMKFNLV